MDLDVAKLSTSNCVILDGPETAWSSVTDHRNFLRNALAFGELNEMSPHS